MWGIILLFTFTIDPVMRARGGLQFSNNSFGGVVSMMEEALDTTPGMFIGSMVGAVELVLDAEVVKLIEHIISMISHHS